MQVPISILPADERMEYLTAYLSQKGAILCHSMNDIATTGLILCTAPFTKDGTHVNTSLADPLPIEDLLTALTPANTLAGGGLPASITDYCQKHCIPYYDFLSSENLAKKNAQLTAEGLLIPLLSKTNYSLCEAVPLIIGYGKCGAKIAGILSSFTDEIYIYDMNPTAMENAKSHGFHTLSHHKIQSESSTIQHINIIINTAPANPFSTETWQCFHNTCQVFQVASGTLTLPYPLCDRYVPCPGIPGKYAPKSAGILIGKDICRHFHL